MKIHNKDILTTTRATVPRTVVRSKTYRNLTGQWFLGPCGSNEYHNESIVEEDENTEMVEESPIQVERLANYDADEDWRAEKNHDFSDKEDDEEEDDGDIEEANLQPQTPIQPTASVSNTSPDPPEIKVTSDESLHQMAQVYRENFDGFAEINRFQSIEGMHEFIKNVLERSPPPQEAESSKQERYLDLLFNEKPEDRFRRLFEISRVTVRRILARNEDILQDLFVHASLDNFPSPLAPLDEFEPILSDDEDDDNNISPLDDSKVIEVEENMKRWYMIEMIGLWLRIITDVKSYRQAIKNNLLKKRWGIENDRYDGIAVPLKYK